MYKDSDKMKNIYWKFLSTMLNLHASRRLET